MAHRKARQGGDSGFTLIELLMILAVIAVLVSILIPISTRVRDQSRTVLCASHVRQLLSASIAYTSDNNGTLFYAPLCNDTINGVFTNEALTPSYKPLPFRMDFSNVMGLGTQTLGLIDYKDASHLGVLWPYIGASIKARQDIFNCPADLAEHPVKGGVQMTGYVRNFSYSFNFCLNHKISNHDHGCMTLAQIFSPSHKILIFEEVGPNDGACYWTGDVDDYPSQRHMMTGEDLRKQGQGISNNTNYQVQNKTTVNGFANIGFVDGHVEAMQAWQFWGGNAANMPTAIYYGELKAP